MDDSAGGRSRKAHLESDFVVYRDVAVLCTYIVPKQY